MKKITVFCLPYAGGSKSIYNEWIDKYSSIAEIVPIEYSGHRNLFVEDFMNTADASAEFICEKICKYN